MTVGSGSSKFIRVVPNALRAALLAFAVLSLCLGLTYAVLQLLYGAVGADYSIYEYNWLDEVLDWVVSTLIWTSANLVLVTAGYPRGERPWIKYTLLSIPLITAVAATVFLSWKTVSRWRGPPEHLKL